MKSGVNILIGFAAVVLLGAMMLTNPDYNSAIRPFVTTVKPGETGETRLISGRFGNWRSADRIQFSSYGTEMIRDTDGIFLVADFVLSGTSESTMLSATWLGASKRRYRATSRISDVPGQIDQLWLQPGLDSKTFAIFELPPDEIEGGSALLSLRLDPPLDGTLLLTPPDSPPVHEAILRLGP